jgi:hypothetical protein
MKRARIVLFLGFVAVLLVTQSAQAQAFAFTASQTLPVSGSLSNPCGEDVAVVGSLHDLYHSTFNSAGGFNFVFHDNPQGISGVGVVTGQGYRAVGSSSEKIHLLANATLSYEDHFLLVSSANKYHLAITFHGTVIPAGSITSLVEDVRITC